MSASEQTIEELVASYFSGTISASEKDKLEAWIRASETNRDYYQQLKNIWEIARPPFAPEQIDTEKVTSRLMRRIQKRNAWYDSTFIHYWQQIAAVLLLPFIGATVYFYAERQNISGAYSEPAMQEITATHGTYARITLPDSSNVWLNGGSTLRYPTRFNNRIRNVDLTGEAYFEVESDVNHPFTVHTRRLTVTATGTAFNVDAYEPDSITAVTMTKGKVQIAIGEMQGFALQPGERIAYNHQLKQYRIQKTDPYKWYAWKDGRLVFRDDPLSYVLKRISQMFNVDIKLTDTTLASQLYRTTLEGESLDEILRLLKMTAPIGYKRLDREKNADNSYGKQRILIYRVKQP